MVRGGSRTNLRRRGSCWTGSDFSSGKADRTEVYPAQEVQGDDELPAQPAGGIEPFGSELLRDGTCDGVGHGSDVYRHRRRVAVSGRSEGFRNSRDRRPRHGRENDHGTRADRPAEGLGLQEAATGLPLHPPFRPWKSILFS